MTYEKFTTEVLIAIQKRLPRSAEAIIRKVAKNNNQIYDGLVITDKDEAVSPTIYLNAFYGNRYLKGASINDICEEILTQYEAARKIDPCDLSFFTDFSKVKDRIIFRIINKKLNKKLLSEIPHIDYLDLSITFLVLLSIHESCDATVLIHDSHLQMWDTDTDELFLLAKNNTPRLLAWEMSDLSKILETLEAPADDLIPSKNDLSCPMYVLSNRIHMHGAGCILYENLLSSLSGELCDDLYIIPSSIHEVLLIPYSLAHSRNMLDEMICEVNRTQVDAEEILSDHAYVYLRNKNTITY